MSGKKVLVVVPAEERHKKLLTEAYPEGEFIWCSKDYDCYLPEAQIIIGNIPKDKIRLASRLEWIQTNNAGVDEYTAPGIVPENVIFSCASGTYGLAISEYMLGCVLSLFKKLNRYRVNQISHTWRDEGHVFSVYGSRTLVIGFGDIGQEFGHRMHLLGSEVCGIRRTGGEKPDWVKEMYSLEDLENIIGEFDVVSLSLPNTPATRHIVDYKLLGRMKKNAVLVNVGRGNAIVTDDLARALNEGLIFGAALDVTDPEPLPKEHPLWDAANVIITPHTSGQYHLPETFERIIRLAAENLRAFTTGGKIKSVVDFKTGYRKNDC